MERLSEDFLFELILYCLKDKDNFDLVFSELGWNLDYSNSKELKRVLLEIRRYRNKKDSVPKLTYLEAKFIKDEEVLDFLDELRMFSKGYKVDEESIVSTLEEFIRRTRFANLYREMGEAYNKGDQDKAFSIFEVGVEKISNFSFRRNRLEMVFADFDTRMARRMIENGGNSDTFKVPFCIDQLNHYTGGAESGEVYMALGDSGTGKSIFLISNGIHAARRGQNVLHIQAEGTKKQIEDRYDKCWSALSTYQINNLHELSDADWEEKNDKFDKIVKNVSGEIYIESYTSFEERPNMMQARELIKNFKKQGIEIHLVLFDYLELFNPISTKWEDETMRQGFVARNMKDIAVEFNCVVGTVTQMQRVDKELKNNPDWMAERDNMGGAYEKVRPMDLFFTFNQTRDEKKKGIMRIFIDKAREHLDKIVFSIYQDLGRSRFVNRIKTRQGYFDPKKSKKK